VHSVQNLYNTAMVSFKIRFGDDIRRISVDKTDSFKGLLGQLRKLFNVGADEDLILKYVDDEGDKVTLASDLEFKEALHCCKEPIQIFVSKCPRSADSIQGTLENLDLSLSRLLVVEQSNLRDGEKKGEEAKLDLARKLQMEKLAEEAKKREEYEIKLVEIKKREEEQRRYQEQLEKERIQQILLEEEKERYQKMLRLEEQKKQEEQKKKEEEKKQEEERKKEQQRLEEQKRQEEERKKEQKKKEEEEQRKKKEEEEQRKKKEQEKMEEEQKKKEEKKKKEEEEQKKKKEQERIERRKLNDNCSPSKVEEKPSPRLDAAWVEYKARNGKTVLLDLSSEALSRFGVQTYQRVNTPAGAATVIGVDQEHGFCWFQLDKDFKEGLSYWDDITNYDSMICKGVVPTGDSAIKQFIPVPKEMDGLLKGISNSTERDALLQAIQESLLDERQKEIQEYYKTKLAQ